MWPHPSCDKIPSLFSLRSCIYWHHRFSPSCFISSVISRVPSLILWSFILSAIHSCGGCWSILHMCFLWILPDCVVYFHMHGVEKTFKQETFLWSGKLNEIILNFLHLSDVFIQRDVQSTLNVTLFQMSFANGIDLLYWNGNHYRIKTNVKKWMQLTEPFFWEK